MAQVEERARIWFYCRDLGFSSSLSNSSQGSSTGAPKALKHWAVILDYMSTKDPGRVNKRILYEANMERGLLVAREVQFGEDEEEDWQQMCGFVKEDHGMVAINEARAKSYCEDFNQLKIKYVATKDNCQRFVGSFIANVLPDAAIALPTTVKEVKSWFDGALSAGSNSLFNLGSAACVRSLITSSIGNGAMDMMLKEAIQQISLNGFGKISILCESPLKEYIAREGKQLVLTSLGEVTENMLNAGRGAFSWWNLLQIPVELIVDKLMRSSGFTDLQAYAGKKLASCLIAAGVGLLAGGPFGCLASVAFWIATEVVATLFKCLLAKLFGEKFNCVFGESDTLKLVKSIYRYFEMKMKGGLNASLQWMTDYIMSTQGVQKKLA